MRQRRRISTSDFMAASTVWAGLVTGRLGYLAGPDLRHPGLPQITRTTIREYPSCSRKIEAPDNNFAATLPAPRTRISCGGTPVTTEERKGVHRLRDGDRDDPRVPQLPADVDKVVAEGQRSFACASTAPATANYR